MLFFVFCAPSSPEGGVFYNLLTINYVYNKKTKMKKRVIILLSVDVYHRENAEAIEDTDFNTLSDIQDHFSDKSTIFYTSMSEFMDDCNDEQINLELYWLTYVNVKS